MTNFDQNEAIKLSVEEVEKLAFEAIQSEKYDDAYNILLPLSEKNSGYALSVIGSFYETGTIVPIDKNIARSYYEKAVKEEYITAFCRLGDLLVEIGDTAQARIIFESGAKLDSLPCMYQIGVMMIEGQGGAVDQTQGREWLRKAAEKGHIFSQRRIIGFEIRESKSIVSKIIAALKILGLMLPAFKEHMKNPDSNRIK